MAHEIGSIYGEFKKAIEVIDNLINMAKEDIFRENSDYKFIRGRIKGLTESRNILDEMVKSDFGRG